MYVFGLAAGIAFGVVIAVIILKIVRKATHREETFAKYDERQVAARGKAFKYSFYTMLVLNALAMCYYSISEETGYQVPVPMVFLGIMVIGLVVCISYSIWTDAYIGTNETYHSSVILIGVIGAVNLAIGAFNSYKGYEEGYINLVIGVMMAVICIEMIAKNIYNRHINADSEE